VPEKLEGAGIAQPGERLPDFAERTYKEFFDVLIPVKKSEKDLAAWITPRLEIIRYSIRQAPLSSQLERAIRRGLDEEGLLKRNDKSQSVGCFVRSDTNVEDLAGFTGAGLNLTVPNVIGFDNILQAVKDVWASPFTERAYGWRQSHMEDPEYVFPAVAVVRSFASQKSGVMVTVDVDTGDPAWLSVAINEGVGGAVEGQAAESLRVPKAGGQLRVLAQATAPTRYELSPQGGLVSVPASGSERVLQPDEIRRLMTFAASVSDRFPALRTAAGTSQPADVEFGFHDGKLGLLQLRPFVESRSAQRSTYLAQLDAPLHARGSAHVDLDAIPQGDKP
jgi:phosphoenolpyruvate synthase/pyruvate phosphate dikinase